MLFNKNLGEAREQMSREVQRLHSTHPKPEVPVRLQEVNNLIEDYVSATGERPEHHDLNRLSDYLLVDVLTDQYKHHRKDDYPIQSKCQVKKQQQRHREYFKTIESLEGVKDAE